MATGNNEPPRQLSLVRYASDPGSDSREVVLRHGSSVVVYDPRSNELLLHKTPQASVGLSDCPFCHRPLHDKTPAYEEDVNVAPENNDHGFVNPDYFRLLAHSIPASPVPSRAPSPFKQLPPLHDEGHGVVTDQLPPSDAEFVGSAPAPKSGEQGIHGSSFVPNYFKSFFVEKRLLGRGGRGVVLLVEHVLDGVHLGEFACKRIPVGNDHGWLEKVLVEVQLLSSLNHPNLVSYRHVWLEDAQITSFGPSVPCIFILQQYFNAGDLHDYVLSSTKSLTEPEELKERMRRKSRGQPDVTPRLEGPRKMHFDEIFLFFRDITSGLHHLHANGYIHRDLKPSNCLLHRTGQKLTVHVSDFGEVQANGAKRASTGATGTISYCAPEVLQRHGAGGEFGNFTTKSDIFSLGMIVYFMCFGHLPYENADEMNEENEDLDKLKAEVSRWRGFDESIRTRPDLPERLYRFLKRLLSPDPATRPSTEQILQAIKAGGDIDNAGSQSPILNENGPRIISVDTPSRQQSIHSRRRKSSTGPVRPGLSSLGRQPTSSELVPSVGSKTRETLHDSPLQSESGIVVRPRKGVTSPPPQNQQEQPPQASRFIMPPPSSLHEKVARRLRSPIAMLTCKGIAFGFKLITLSWPCTPYAASPWIFYSLMSLSVLDFLVHLGPGGSLMLLGLHVLVWATAMRWGMLCSQSILHWETV